MFKQLSFFALLAAACLFTACGGGVFTSQVTLEIDNPLDTTIVVTIDSATYTLAADSSVEVTFPVGTYKLNAKTVTDSTIRDTEFTLEDNGDAILNIGGVEYVKEYVYYSTSGSYAALDAYTFKYDTMAFEGVRAEAVGKASELVVYGDWDHGINEEAPETITTYADGGTWKTQMHRMEDFVFLLELSKLLEDLNLDDMDLEGLFDEEGEEGEEEDHGHDHDHGEEGHEH